MLTQDSFDISHFLGKQKTAAHLLVGLFLVCFGALIGLAAAIEPFLAAPAVAAFLLLPLAIRKPHLVVLTIAAYTPFEEFVLKWLPAKLDTVLRLAPEAVLILLLGLLVLRNLREGVLWWRTPLDLPVLCFLSISAVSAFVNEVPTVVWILGVREFTRYLILYYVVINVGFSDKFTRMLIKVLFAAATLQAAIGLMQSLLGPGFASIFVPRPVTLGETEIRAGFTQAVSGGTRIFGTLGRYGRFGFFLVIFLLLGGGFFLSLRSTLSTSRRLGFVSFCSITCAALALSFSRTSWFSLYAGLLVLLLLSGRIKALLLAGLIPILATVVLVSSVQLESWTASKAETATLTERYVGTFSVGYLDVLMERGRLFILSEVAPLLLRDYTWLGMGPGTIGSIATGGGTNSRGFYPEYSRVDALGIHHGGIQWLHDVGWVAILAQVGVLGLITFFLIIAQLGATALQCYRRSPSPFVRGFSLGYLALLATVILANFSNFYLSLRAISMYVWLLGGILTIYWIRLKSDANVLWPSRR